MNSSILAKDSPRHTRFPTLKGITCGLLWYSPFSLRNRVGSNFSGFGNSWGSWWTWWTQKKMLHTRREWMPHLSLPRTNLVIRMRQTEYRIRAASCPPWQSASQTKVPECSIAAPHPRRPAGRACCFCRTFLVSGPCQSLDPVLHATGFECLGILRPERDSIAGCWMWSLFPRQTIRILPGAAGDRRRCGYSFRLRNSESEFILQRIPSSNPTAHRHLKVHGANLCKTNFRMSHLPSSVNRSLNGAASPAIFA